MKKILCVILSILMCLPFALVASAYTDREGSSVKNEITRVNTDTPVIIVRGMQFTEGLKFDRGTENEKAVKPVFDAGKLFKALSDTFAQVLKTGTVEAGVSVICDYVSDLFGDYACDENGDSVYDNITAENYPLAVANYPEIINREADGEISLLANLVDRYGEDTVYYYVYDWRLDPMDNADTLNAMVNTALSDHNADKVDIICCSMGGSIAMAYMSKYGYSKIDTLISNTSVMFGADVISDLFCGKVEFNANAVKNYLCQMLPSVSGFVKVLSFTGILDALCKALNRFVEKYKVQIFEESLVPTFATLPGFWSMADGEVYEDCKEFIFGGKEEQYSGLIARTDNFYNNVSSRREELTAEAIQSGVKLVILADYNTPLIPAYESAKYQGDGVIETAAMSGGAITSVIGETLSEEQLKIGDEKYISADKCINASTCLYPDYTWFVKDAGHVAGKYASDYSFFIFALLESEVQPDINMWENYPQFMQSDSNESLAVLK